MKEVAFVTVEFTTAMPATTTKRASRKNLATRIVGGRLHFDFLGAIANHLGGNYKLVGDYAKENTRMVIFSWKKLAPHISCVKVRLAGIRENAFLYTTVLKTIFYSPRPSNLRRALKIIIPMTRICTQLYRCVWAVNIQLVHNSPHASKQTCLPDTVGRNQATIH
eukprot:9373244-Pyramimonas_sp.AAC.2